MSRNNGRVDQLFRVLSAQERGTMVMRALRDGRRPDPQVYERMPESQRPTVERLTSLACHVDLLLTEYIGAHHAFAEQLALQLLLLTTARAWDEERQTARHLIGAHWPEPVTLLEFEAARDEARAESLAVEEAAELFLGLKPDIPDGEWDARYGAALERLEAAVEAGTVQEGSGPNTVEAGSFYDWLGLPTPAYGEWGEAIGYPDPVDRALIEGMGKLRQQLLDLLVRVTPGQQALGMTGRLVPTAGEVLPGLPPLTETVVAGLRRCWEGLEAARIVVDEIAEVFDGDDPLPLEARESLEEAQDLARHVATELGKLDIEIAVDEPSAAAIDYLRELVHRGR